MYVFTYVLLMPTAYMLCEFSLMLLQFYCLRLHFSAVCTVRAYSNLPAVDLVQYNVYYILAPLNETERIKLQTCCHIRNSRS